MIQRTFQKSTELRCYPLWAAAGFFCLRGVLNGFAAVLFGTERTVFNADMNRVSASGPSMYSGVRFIRFHHLTFVSARVETKMAKSRTRFNTARASASMYGFRACEMLLRQMSFMKRQCWAASEYISSLACFFAPGDKERAAVIRLLHPVITLSHSANSRG